MFKKKTKLEIIVIITIILILKIIIISKKLNLCMIEQNKERKRE